MLLSSSPAIVGAASPTSMISPARASSLLRSNGLHQQSGLLHGSKNNLGIRLSANRNSKGSGLGLGLGLGIRCKVGSATQDDFDVVVLQSELPVLVDFWAEWCGPCKLVAVSMEAVDKKYTGKLKVVKVETDSNPKLVQAYKVYGLPTLIMFRDGKAMAGGRHEGAISSAKVEAMIKKVLPSLAPAN